MRSQWSPDILTGWLEIFKTKIKEENYKVVLSNFEIKNVLNSFISPPPFFAIKRCPKMKVFTLDRVDR
jgi:hypothetical protein